MIVLLYLVSHLWSLGTFPVFADEAIYIRWAQLAMDDWSRYAFFALNDGKPPLYIWLLTTTQLLVSDQLVAGRVVSVLVGLGQLVVTALLLRQLRAKPGTQLFAVLAVTILPFWFLYHHLALMDGLLTLLLTICFWATLRASQETSRDWWWSLVGGLALGAALWTKLPAIFFLPTLLLIPWLRSDWRPLRQRSVFFAVYGPVLLAIGSGLAVFASMAVVPGFGQLFARGQDFTFTTSELLAGKWTESFVNFGRFGYYFGTYLTWPFLILTLSGVFQKFHPQRYRQIAILLLAAFVFCAPFLLFGRVVYPRYLLPAVIFLTVAGALALESLCQRVAVGVRQQRPLWYAAALAVALLAGQSFSQASFFMASFIFSPNVTPLVQVDRTQYLEEWSSGHGIRESVAVIQQLRQRGSLAVATEGRFGTLPDALLLFFHRRPVDNLYIEGIGQYPVKSLPEFFTNRARQFDRSILIVNSHRMELPLPADRLLASFCRPNQAPCLQIWDVTTVVQSPPSNQNP